MRLSKKFQLAALGILFVGIIAIAYFSLTSGAPPAPPPNGVDTDGDGVVDAQVSFSVYQCMRIVYADGSDSWKYPQSRTSLQPLTIGDSGKIVSQAQAYFYFNIAASKQVSAVSVSSNAAIQLYNYQKAQINSFGSQVISQVVGNPDPDVDVYITSATLTASDIQNLLGFSSPSQTGTYYWVIKLSDISASVTFADGTHATLGLTGVQATENQLWWQFGWTWNPGDMSIVSKGVEWAWT